VIELESVFDGSLHVLQVFLLKGRFIFGPDARSLFVTMFLIVAPASIFCAFVVKELMDTFSYGLGLPVMIAAVLFTACVSMVLSLFQITTLIYFLSCAVQVLLLNTYAVIGTVRVFNKADSFSFFKLCLYSESILVVSGMIAWFSFITIKIYD